MSAVARACGRGEQLQNMELPAGAIVSATVTGHNGPPREGQRGGEVKTAVP